MCSAVTAVTGSGSEPKSLLPATHMLSTRLEGRGKRMHARAEEDRSAFGRAGVHQPDLPDAAAPFPRKHLGRILPACQAFRYGEVIFAEEAPQLCSRQQVAGIVDWTEDFAKSAKKDGLEPPRAAPEPTVDRAIP